MECPIEPDQSECCNSGCNPCIFDVYERQLQKYKKGQLEGLQVLENCLKELKYCPFKLTYVIRDSKYANIYIFQCNSHECDEKSQCNVYCEPGQHLLIKMQSKFDGSDFTRAYTPIPWDGASSKEFAMLIKLYPNGDMSQCIKMLKIGDETLWRGPYGDFRIDFNVKSMLMIAQGTGIAPLYAIVKKILANDECEVRMKLIYCCRNLEQVHLRNQLYALLDYWNFTYEVFLSCQDDLNADGVDVKYKEVVYERRLQDEDIERQLSDENWSQVLICGTNAFTASLEQVIKAYSSVPVHIF